MATSLLAETAVTDPYAALAELREHSPIVWDDSLRAWLVTRHEDVHAAFVDRRLSADRITGFRDHLDEQARRRFAPTYEILSGWAVFNDPPVHTRLRASLTWHPTLISRALTRLAVQV